MNIDLTSREIHILGHLILEASMADKWPDLEENRQLSRKLADAQNQVRDVLIFKNGSEDEAMAAAGRMAARHEQKTGEKVVAVDFGPDPAQGMIDSARQWLIDGQQR